MGGFPIPDLMRDWFHNWLTQLVGPQWMPIIIAVAIIAWAITHYWDKITSHPFVSPVLSLIFRKRLPKADPSRFAVAIAHLDNDKNHQHEHFIVDALQDFEGIQVLSVDRTIFLKATAPEHEKQKSGHAKARQYLKKSRADMLIWGRVQSIDGKSAPRLYWTTLHDDRRSTELFRLQESFKLPALFWSDLVQVLRLVITTHAAKFWALRGHFIAHELTPFIDRVRELTVKPPAQPSWNADTRAEVSSVLASALFIVGEQTGMNGPLEEAVAAYRVALAEATRERVLPQWVTAQNNLGTALMFLGEREAGTTHLEEAVAAHRAALAEATREQVPSEWTRTQNNLGLALARLGEREAGTTHLEEAVAACREALEEWTRERVPLDWATAQNNLGAALIRLGRREAGTTHLEEAVAAFRAALEEATRERVPLEWANTQSNLGAALTNLGQRRMDATLICEALGHHLMALEVLSTENPSLASMIATAVKANITAIKQTFGHFAYQKCFATHEKMLKRLSLS
jgi:tetratricopeptide (TPR) repeat protein